jgi:hypothetical protein
VLAVGQQLPQKEKRATGRKGDETKRSTRKNERRCTDRLVRRNRLKDAAM